MSQPSMAGIQYRDSFLSIVPAVHYRLPFAQLVNEIACDPDSRPDAIAVELGPCVTVAAIDWLRELGVGPEQRRSLPCLLGLTERQRYLSVELRDKAMALQIESGKPLEALPAEVLARELNYYPTLVTPFSPTDSIIEALRCALELDVPIYGVDLDEHAPIESAPLLFPDTVTACGRVQSYLAENVGLAASTPCRVNQRREYAMAARLKELLLNNKKVLFTCGLAHWQRVIELIEAPEVLATTNIDSCAANDQQDRFQRVVIHPSMAAACLDRLPAVARLYERQRRHPLLGNPKTASTEILVADLFDSTLQHGIRNHLRHRDRFANHIRHDNDRLNRLVDFPRVVKIHSALSLNQVPSVAACLRCARVFVSESFAVSLAKTFFRYPWARADDYQACELLSPNDKNGIVIRRDTVAEDRRRRDDMAEVSRVDEDGNTLDESGPQDPEPGPDKQRGYHFTWTPWEELVTGLSDTAIALGRKRLAAGRSEPLMAEAFKGSMQRGIAFKETLLARARGDRRIRVLVDPSTNTPAPENLAADMTEGWPVVWIFDNQPRADSVWNNLVVPLSWLEPFLHENSVPGLYNGSASNLSSLVCFEDENRCRRVEPHESGVHASTLRGLIVFGPIFHHDRQYARWLELSRGLRNPLSAYDRPSGIPSCVSQHCGTQGTPLGQLRWQDDIVRMALPYAGRQLTVVVPRHCNLDPLVLREAALLGKNISPVTLDQFANSDVLRARSNLMVPGITHDSSPQYALDAQSSIDENHKRFAHRMPEKWKRFGL